MFKLRNGLRNGLMLGAAIAAIASTAGTAQAQAKPYNDYNYIGGGISDEGFVVNGKVRVFNAVSVRPAAIVDYDFNDATFLVPVTYDFRPFKVGGSDLLPFAGGGIRVDTENDTNFGVLLTGGADYRFSERWTANGSVNVTFIDDTDIDFTAGVGYTF
ncbi:MAG: hypothetical protein HC857_17990 [Synechococcales cyanobacterium RU_4_20]|nr:hypothetical protein [Synechococcales cyanobacterium RU_4_20]NJR68271.1 hypothetical protein [Synechococcales cyanobacterium CRU_2_2]